MLYFLLHHETLQITAFRAYDELVFGQHIAAWLNRLVGSLQSGLITVNHDSTFYSIALMK